MVSIDSIKEFYDDAKSIRLDNVIQCLMIRMNLLLYGHVSNY